MKRNQSSLIWGVLLVVFGALMLLDRIGVISGIGGIVWAIIFGGAGAAFIYVYVTNSQRWWAIIPGFSLLGLAVLLGLDTIAPRLGDTVGTPIFLGAIGASFGAVYLTQRHAWWAIIPFGTIVSTALVVLLDAVNPPFDSGAVMLLGLSATFALVAITGRGQTHERGWAMIPAGILGAIGLMILADSIISLKFLWPLVIVAVGAFFVVRGLGRDTAAAAKQPGATIEPDPPTQKVDDVWNKDQS